MSNKKQSKKLTNNQPKTSAQKPNIEKEPNPANDSLMGFYFRALLLALAFGAFIWYVVVHDYVDMGEAEKIAKRMEAKDQTVTNEQKKLLDQAKLYNNSFQQYWFYNYKWVYHNLLNKNLAVQAKADTLDLMGKQAYKNGTDYQYIKIILEKTPEDAVILMPDVADITLPKDAPPNTPKFERIKEKAWCTYFLYPRTLVFDETDGADSLGGKVNFRKDPDYAEKRKKITHVAIVYGNGYEHLNYQVTQREPYTCLPVNPSNSINTPNNPGNIQNKEKADESDNQ